MSRAVGAKGNETGANPLSATVRVERSRGCRRYDRMLFGQFLEHFHRQVYGGVFEPGSPLSNDAGFRLDVVEALRELRVPVVRWPGGCFVSSYHWKDAVGPSRQPSYDKAWRVEELNTFGTDEFVAWCRLIGAEPYICTNAGSGTPEEMSDWVEYCNLDNIGRWARLRQANGHREPHSVRYWSIGNENYGEGEIGAKSIDEWGRCVTESAKMMKRVDPSITLLAAALPEPEWTLPLLRHAGRYLDAISIHGYWDELWQHDDPSDYSACMMQSLQPEHEIRVTEQIVAAAGHEGMAIAFDEWNLRGWHHPLTGNTAADVAARNRNDVNSTYTIADAVFSAIFLNTCLRHADRVLMANMAPVVNTRGPLFAHPRGIVKRTSFHVMAMYASLLATSVANANVTSDPFTHGGASVPALDAVATCDDAMECWRFILVNRHPNTELTCSVSIADTPIEGVHKATVLSGVSPDDYNDIDSPDRVTPEKLDVSFSGGVTRLRPHSVTIIEIG